MVHTSELHPIIRKKLSKSKIGRQTIKELEVAHKVLNAILQKISNLKKPELIKNDLIPEFSLIITKVELDKILENKCWQNDSVMAKNLGITRQRISQIRKNGKISPQIAGMIAFHMGNLNSNWWRHFSLEIVDWKRFDSPKWNYAKYDGTIPYTKYSRSAELRSLDGEVEKIV